MEKITLVNRSDQILGTKEKYKAHASDGVLHRAISVWIVNSKGEILITERSRKKLLWPGFWSNTICSHPRLGESYIKAGERRLMEELGFSCRLQYLYKFVYEEKYKDIGWERELCGVVIGRYDPPSCKATEGRGGGVRLNKDEIFDYRWVGWKELKKWSEEEKDKFTPWFFMEKQKLEKIDSFKKFINN